MAEDAEHDHVRPGVFRQLLARFPDLACTVCGERSWAWIESALVLEVWSEVTPRQPVQVAMLVCQNCGQTLLFHLDTDGRGPWLISPLRQSPRTRRAEPE